MRHAYRFFAILLTLAGVLPTAGAADAGAPYVEGLHYQRIDPPQPGPDRPGRVEVVEMFLYACPHCYELEPKLRRWLQDKPYVDFRRIPAIVGPTWADQARAFYMAGALGKPEALNAALFRAIHEDGAEIYNQYGVVGFFTGQGYNEQRIRDLYLSPEIGAAVNEARRLTVKYSLRGVPAVIVNGTYITAPYFVRNQEEMFQVLDVLVERARTTPGVTNAEVSNDSSTRAGASTGGL